MSKNIDSTDRINFTILKPSPFELKNGLSSLTESIYYYINENNPPVKSRATFSRDQTTVDFLCQLSITIGIYLTKLIPALQ